MKKREEKKEILNGIYTQIYSFDNKAGTLISVIGIVFALSLDFLAIFHNNSFIDTNCLCMKIFYFVLFFLYILSFIAAIMCFVFVIIPRKHNGEIKNVNYYMDIVNMDKTIYEKKLNDYVENDDILINQIKINAKICCKKHRWLNVGIICLIPYFLAMLMLIILIIMV